MYAFWICESVKLYITYPTCCLLKLHNKLVLTFQLAKEIPNGIKSEPHTPCKADSARLSNNESECRSQDSQLECRPHDSQSDCTSHGSQSDTVSHGGQSDCASHDGQSDTVSHGGQSDCASHDGQSDTVSHGGQSDCASHDGQSEMEEPEESVEDVEDEVNLMTETDDEQPLDHFKVFLKTTWV